MIPRYTRPEMANIWLDDTRYRIWLDIELLAADAMAKAGTIPAGAPAAIRAGARFEADRIAEIERETRHDIIAFLTNVAEHAGPSARFLHRGMTSSDVLDTAFSVQLTRASDLLLADIDDLLGAIASQAQAHRYSYCIGRSHGIHAEPTSFGLKLASHYAEFHRNRSRLIEARKEIAVCAISGPVGTFADIDPAIEAHVAEQLGLRIEPVSSQIIPRDRHAMFFAVLAVIASSAERLATEIRHLQRTEIGEVEEYFAPGQKGSSAMPHKRNPILSENITGLARYVRSALTPALENIVLWHERDISHSSVERIIAPDATIALDFLLARLSGMISKLTIKPAVMQENLNQLHGVVFSQQVLLALLDAGMSREDAYRLVQHRAMQALGGAGEFADLLARDAEMQKFLSRARIDELFDLPRQLRHIDDIFARVFTENST